jgi:hypothetical protein
MITILAVPQFERALGAGHHETKAERENLAALTGEQTRSVSDHLAALRTTAAPADLGIISTCMSNIASVPTGTL